jgi:TolB-like protein
MGPPRQQLLRRRGLRRAWALLGATAAIAALGSVYFLRRGPPAAPAPAPVSAPAPILPETRSIAVLPLVNVGGDPKDEYFSDGMSDELASALSKVPGLRVASRTSAFTFKGRKDVDIRQIGKQLNVGTVLEGAVRRAGNRLRISTQLTSVADGLTLWSETYERDLKDVFQIQEEIARATAGALRLTLEGGPGQSLASDRTANLEAHDLYLQGRFLFKRYNEADLRRSLDLFERALAQDSLYAPAYVGISLAWTFLADDWLAPKAAYPKAERAARRALELDSTLAGAYIALALPLIWYEWDFAGAEEALKRAIELKPDADAHAFYGDYLRYMGRLGEAEVELRRALLLDPLSPGQHEGMSELFLRGGRLDEALEQARRSVALDPSYAYGHQGLAEAYRAKGMLSGALAEYGRAVDLGWHAARAGRALTLVQMGRAAEARRLARELEEESTRRYVAPDWIAVIYARLGDREAAFSWLQRTLETRSMWATSKDLPDWDPIRRDPRFAAIVRRMGLAP